MTNHDTVDASYEVRISEQARDPDWDAFVSNMPGGHYTQTSLWGQVKSLSGWHPARVALSENGQIVAGAQMLIHRVPLIGAVAYVSKGPLCLRENRDVLESTLKGLHLLSRAHRVQYLVLQPPTNGTSMAHCLSSLGFAPTGVTVAVTASVVLDLSSSLEHILRHMKRQTRQNILRSERAGIAVRVGAEADLAVFFELNRSTCRRRGVVPPYPLDYYLHLWRVLDAEEYVKLFVAEYEGQAVSALLCMTCGDTVIAHTLGWSGRCANRRPNNGLFWAAIKWAKVQGYRCFDFGGIDRSAAESILVGEALPALLLRSPNFFKISFGGQVALFPQPYSYVYPAIPRWLGGRIAPRVPGARHLQSIVADIARRTIG
jgi:lipid II:glycine glycyltransferase (peptidoglycan interpeptide bridge formation enzyme)